MEEYVFELKDIVRKWVPEWEELSEQKNNVLAQVKDRAITIEGLKLLSMLVEVDSCKKHSCKHNTKMTVNAILRELRVTCPTLPDVTPDGYCMVGDVLILLEVFVRTSQEAFEKKYNQDFLKLLQLSSDLKRQNITLVPVIDGRSSYYVEFVPDWVVERLRWLLLKLMDGLRTSGEEVEELEYERLISSLSSLENQSLGLESLLAVKERGLPYKVRLEKALMSGINNKLTTDQCRTKIMEIFQQFKMLQLAGQLDRKLQATDREDMISRLQNHEFIQCSVKDVPKSEIRLCEFCSVHILGIIGQLRQSEVKHSSTESREYFRVLSICNKIKSQKVFNTRRNTMLVLDLIMYNILCDLDKSSPGAVFREVLLMQGLPSVNDRLINVDFLMEQITKKFIKNPNWLEKAKKRLSSVCGELPLDDILPLLREPDVEYYFNLKTSVLDEWGAKPCLQYKTKSQCMCGGRPGRGQPDYTIMGESEFEELLKTLSSLSLSLINSMKTAAVPKMKVNNADEFYGKVYCDEVFFQRFGEGGSLTLLYQKTGERSRCYAVAYRSKSGGLYETKASFYCDPKRFFLPIFSADVIQRTCVEMLSWLDFMSQPLLDSVSDLLRRLILCILCTPSKRIQVYLQGFRYYIMAFVNEVHFKELFEKLKVVMLTPSEWQTAMLIDDLILLVLSNSREEDMAKIFKFVLNVSYLCHFITKETPDRLTDQIKCFEKFLEPKLKFDSVLVNPSNSMELPTEEEEKMVHDIERLLGKKLESKCEGRPGLNKDVLSVCLSLFNSSSLEVKPLLPCDPMTPSFTSTALDMSSNKSVVVPKLNEVGEVITEYDYSSIVSAVVVEMIEHFKTKGKYKLDPKEVNFKILKRLSSLIQIKKESIEPDGVEELLSEDQGDCLKEIETRVAKVLSKVDTNVKTNLKTSCPLERLWPKSTMVVIKRETSLHDVKDFDYSLFSAEVYEDLVNLIYEDVTARSVYFADRLMNPCPLEFLIKNLTLKAYKEADYFECFKYILIASDYDNRVGRYDHKSRSRLGFTDAALQIRETSRISSRESNSESIAKRLDQSFFTNSSLRNLCFYSDESPTERSGVSTNVGRLKFGLSYKEQVGGNRELYVGDLNTKLTTRLIEDYSESLMQNMRYTCLNNEKEFERALLDMKSVVRQSGLAVSMDHSKWGPHMSPVIFAALLKGLEFKLKDGSEVPNAAVINILLWHIHKMVEVPFNVVEAYMKGFLKRGLGMMDKGGCTIAEEFMFGYFEKGKVPSHISSVLDMGQGILHNTSDLYGLITEQFINYALELCYGARFISYTSSDDEIMLSLNEGFKFKDRDELNVELVLDCMEFHYFLSDKLNKFVSPKTVVGTFASEFKSRFFIWSQEVPLLTKFVAAALHNIKAKAPNQQADTIDTILDQCVANGVSIEVVGAIAKRTNSMIIYSGFPNDPFLCLEEMDVLDWVNGSRGYRLQRSIETLFPDDLLLSIIRKACRKIFYKIQSGALEESYIVTTLQQSPDDCLKQLLETCDVETEAIEDALNIRWLNLRVHGDLRLVLRTKLMSTTRTVQREEIPSLVKSVQSKLSKNYVRGAKKILADAINKSAFQSSIASGFIGVCKSMGSKCVRDGKGGFKYIRDITSKIILHRDCHFCNQRKGVYCKAALGEVSEYSRPLIWDYFALVLTNACELGNWVFQKAEVPKIVTHLNNPNHFWPIKPSTHSELEDKVGINHILYSIRRNFPTLFDEHISPFLSDLNMLRLSWVQRIKFLDLCVAIDITSECLGIVSHIIKHRREELYIVKQNELAMSHSRESHPLERGFNLEPEEVCTNFLIQILFESMLVPVIMSTSQFKKYFWFGELELLPNNAQHDLKQLTQFICDCKKNNTSRTMNLDDLDVGFVSSKLILSCVNLNISVFINELDWVNRDNYENIEQLILASPSEVIPIELNLTFSHKRVSHKFRYERSTNYILKLRFLIERESLLDSLDSDGYLLLNPHSVEYYVSQSSGNHISLDGVSLLVLNPLINGKDVLDFNDLLEGQDIHFKSRSTVFQKVRIDLKNRFKDLKNKFSYKLIGPDVGMQPLILEGGLIKEGNRVVSRLEVNLDSKVVIIALEALEPEKRPRFIANLFQYLSSAQSHNKGISMNEQDLRLMIENFPEVFEHMLHDAKDWLNCGHFSIIRSKTLGSVMIADETGPFKIKGIRCRKLFEDNESVEIE
uniref:RNA-directed RNA polymerase L n=1 Tax=Pichinde mammarenavirus TaxID=3052300 RepID=B3SN56_PIARV|nr:L polymerase [Pichinde virus]